MMRYFIILYLFFISEAFAQSVYQDSSNQGQASQALDHPPIIFSSINPIYQIAKFISGDDKSNFLLVNPRVSEYNYSINPNQINSLNKADLIIYVSDDLENTLPQFLAKVSNKTKIIQLVKSKNIELITFQTRANENVVDPYIWLSPKNAIGIATEIANTLSALYPKQEQTYRKNLEKFKFDVQNVDKSNRIELLKVRPKSFLIDLNNTVYFESYYNIRAAGVIRYNVEHELNFREVDKINNLIKREKVACVMGNYQERNGLALQIATNNNVKFSLIDVMGSEVNYDQNGYAKMLSALVSDLVKCVNK